MNELTATRLIAKQAIGAGIVHSYIDNLAKAMRHQTRVMMDLVRKFYAPLPVWRGQQRAAGARAKKRRVYRLAARNN